MSDENMQHGRDTHDHDMTYENEQSTVTIPLKEYDKLKQQGQYITDQFIFDNQIKFLRTGSNHFIDCFNFFICHYFLPWTAFLSPE